MSYPGSQQQFGLSDLQLLQRRVMLAHLQERQKQQQLGQLGDVKPQGSLNHLSRFGIQASGGQMSNLNSGVSGNAGEWFTASNLNWMLPNASLPGQAISSSSYFYDQGLMLNLSQQPDISLYGTPVAAGRSNLGHYSPLLDVSQSSMSVLSVGSEQKPTPHVPLFANSFFGDKQSVPLSPSHSIDSNSLSRQGLQSNKSMVRVPSEPNKQSKLDPLEEKILFDTEESGWHSSFSRLATVDTEDFESKSGHTEFVDPYPSIQSGSWSALMQSAVAETTSSDTGVQEELSGLSFQNTELSTDNQQSNFVTVDKQHVKGTESNSRSSSSNLKTHPSSCDSIMSSTVPSFQQTGLQFPFKQTENKVPSDTTSEQQQHLSHVSESPSQGQPKQYVHVRYLGNDCVGLNNLNLKDNVDVQNSYLNENFWQNDVFKGSRSSTGMTGGNYETVQRQTFAHQYLTIADATLDQKENKSLGYDGNQQSNSPMSIEAPNKSAAQSQNCYRGANSSDSYNSIVSLAYTAQPYHTFLNPDDSESSARSNQKFPKQFLYPSSRAAISQQESFSSVKPSIVSCASTDSVIKGNSDIAADALSKGSPASDFSASLDSQYTSECKEANPPMHYKGSSTTTFGYEVSKTETQEMDGPQGSMSNGIPVPDIFSFQNSNPGDSSHFSLGNRQKCQTWWMPSSFGHSVPPLQGSSLASDWSGKCSILENSEASNRNMVRSPHGSVFPGPLYVNNWLENKKVSNVCVASESIQKNSHNKSQQDSISASSQDSCLPENVGTSGFQCSTLGTRPTSVPFVAGTNKLGMKPHNVSMNMPSHRDVFTDSCKVSSSVCSTSSPSDLLGIHPSSSFNPSSLNSDIMVGGGEQFGNKRSHECKPATIQGGEILQSVEKSPMLSGQASGYLGYISTEQTNRSFPGTSSGALLMDGQSQHYGATEHIKQELVSSFPANIVETDIPRVNLNSNTAVSSLNVHQIPDVLRQQRLHEARMPASNPVGCQVDAAFYNGSCPPVGSKSSMGIPKSVSALQYMHPSKYRVLGDNFPHGRSSDNNMVYDKLGNLNIPPTFDRQYEYLKNGQILSLFDAPVLSSVNRSEIFQLSGTHGNAIGCNDCDILQSSNYQMVTNEQALSSSVLPASAGDLNLGLGNPRKRKVAASYCLPWHREVMQSCLELPEICIAEQEWAEATNRLIEKRKDQGDKFEEMRPAGHAKKRLILNTQLLQQVFRPSPPNILIMDANSEYEIIAYYVSKLALADASRLINTLRTGCHVPHEHGDIDAGRLRNAFSTVHHSLPKTAEKLVKRIKRLESNLAGLDRSLSVVDLRWECQELEKFSVINRFAKYHNRVTQFAATDPASSSSAVASARPFLRRYVIAVPLPHKLPEEMQCLSL